MSGRNGRLDVHKGWNQPIGQSLYPPLPWHSRDGQHLVVVYETDLEPVLDWLPTDLRPAHEVPRVIAWLGRYDFCTGGGPYAEVASLVPVLFEGRTYNYPISVILSGDGGVDEWFASGREVWGHAKKLGKVHLEKDEGKGLVRGWADRPHGRRLVEISVGPFERVADPSEFEFAPVVSVRTIPHPERPEPETVQLLETATESEVRRGSDGVPWLWAGEASLTLHESEQDPWYQLPVRTIVAGYYVGFHMVTPYAKILKTYV